MLVVSDRSRIRVLAAMLASLVVVSSCSVSRPASDSTGEQIYQQLCASCHSEDLTGGVGPPLGPGSNASEQPDEFLRVTIVNGRGRMPSFSSSLDSEQLDRLIGYLREVQGK